MSCKTQTITGVLTTYLEELVHSGEIKFFEPMYIHYTAIHQHQSVADSLESKRKRRGRGKGRKDIRTGLHHQHNH